MTFVLVKASAHPSGGTIADWEPTRVNALSSSIPSRIRGAAHFATDGECLDWVAATAGKLDPAEVTLGWIRNTLELGRLAVDPNLRPQIAGHAQAAIEGEIRRGVGILRGTWSVR